jgi:4,5-DOPA dioxygenase extradiol
LTKFPSLFISHGSPMTVIEDSRARRYLSGLGEKIGRPEAILIASAHWEYPVLAMTTAKRLDTIHDFGGFPQALFDCRYEPPGIGEFAEKISRSLSDAGLELHADPRRGIDHGGWSPLILMYPEADIPTAQISIETARGPAHQLAVGKALAGLRGEGVLIIGSGSMTHNLRSLIRSEPDCRGADWAIEFSEWVAGALADSRVDDLLNWKAKAPHARYAHPTDEHFLPLFTALGAGGSDAVAERLHSSYSYGSLSMDCYAFH